MCANSPPVPGALARPPKVLAALGALLACAALAGCQVPEREPDREVEDAAPVEAVNVQRVRRLAALDIAPAQRILGIWLLRGDGVEQDEREAARWLRMAAAQRDRVAEYFLGLMSIRGIGMSKNPVAAVRWLSHSARRGYLEAQYMLGLTLSTGIRPALPPDPRHAYQWLWIAGHNGHARAAALAAQLGERMSADALLEAGAEARRLFDTLSAQ